MTPVKAFDQNLMEQVNTFFLKTVECIQSMQFTVFIFLLFFPLTTGSLCKKYLPAKFRCKLHCLLCLYCPYESHEKKFSYAKLDQISQGCVQIFATSYINKIKCIRFVIVISRIVQFQ